MPVTVHAETRRMDQDEFGQVAYEVMNCVFGLHNALGRFFHEDIYRDEILRRFPGTRKEVQIEVCFRDFRKDYFMDLLVNAGAVFELKAVQALTERHRSQLMNYLLLAELPHGKLVNLGAELVEHEFVNALLTRQQRTAFEVRNAEWQEPEAQEVHVEELVTNMLRDWGTGLDVHLYEEALTHFLGGEARVLKRDRGSHQWPDGRPTESAIGRPRGGVQDHDDRPGRDRAIRGPCAAIPGPYTIAGDPLDQRDSRAGSIQDHQKGLTKRLMTKT